MEWQLDNVLLNENFILINIGFSKKCYTIDLAHIHDLLIIFFIIN